MTAAEGREALVEALRSYNTGNHGSGPWLSVEECVDQLLLPVVDAIARRRAQAAKAEVWRLAASWVGPPFAEEFTARADALEAQ